MNGYNPFSLAGKTVLVTGASSGIGRATAIECSKMGATLVITGRNEERLAETFAQLEGSGHAQITADLTVQEDIERLVASSPQLNGLVLCAGRSILSPLPFCTREKLDSVFNINFFSPVEVMRQLVRGKKIEKQGSIVAIVSIGGTGKFTPGNAMYGSSKAALTSIVKYAATELAAKKIRVNAINPGMVETPLIRRGMVTDEQYAADMSRYPLKRYGRPEEVAYAAIYLLSDAAAWVTGTSLVIDGGVTI
ncbi:MAG: SDR family oxidoreductase [Kiritimatiellae bacterium]|nr:SDR family oxidoreductase [Kiritimatiellia bacterium]